jgi:nicotinamide riboside transporter PnuC
MTDDISQRVRLIEAIGAGGGIIGALIAAQGNPYLMPSAYLIWIISSLALVYVAFKTRLFLLSFNQVIYFIINLLGVINWQLH